VPVVPEFPYKPVSFLVGEFLISSSPLRRILRISVDWHPLEW
jgi:hypothetical protein